MMSSQRGLQDRQSKQLSVNTFCTLTCTEDTVVTSEDPNPPGLCFSPTSSRLRSFWAATAQPCDLRQVSPTPSPFEAPVFSLALPARASSPIQNLRPAPACLPIAPHTLTRGPWEACDSDGVSDAESGSELAAAGSQEQTRGPRQTEYLGLGSPGPD